MTEPFTAAVSEFPELRLLRDLRDAGWTFVPVVVDGEMTELHGTRLWPQDWVDTIVVRFTTDATGLRCEPTGDVVWHRSGSLVEVVDGLLALPMPTLRRAPRLVTRPAGVPWAW